MKIFGLTQIHLEKPVTITAKDNEHASAMVVAALSRCFGQMPSVVYSISEWRPPSSPEKEMLEQLVELGEPGFVEKHERFWDIFDPFDLW